MLGIARNYSSQLANTDCFDLKHVLELLNIADFRDPRRKFVASLMRRTGETDGSVPDRKQVEYLDQSESLFVNGNSRILNWRYIPYKAIILGYIPLHSPYIGLIYLVGTSNFGFLEWPLSFGKLPIFGEY